ncbi:hypothetical protein CKAH01_18415 [Colletotrichum kahawae]|uniref:ToxB-like N-terminal ascomycota domain-containing protein n=1 Tax=Colletotrichum kahawae TaxID=34407 RepID=A0AAD9Y8T8_COLKA|nr:hypothetical protein CKAH01_18415 [Colletotrichum kahawae]
MEIKHLSVLAAVCVGFSAAQSCKIELINVNQAVVDSACIAVNGLALMTDTSARQGPAKYWVGVNSSCGVSLPTGQALADGASLRNAGRC